MQIVSSEHLDAENDGGEGGIGGAAEKSYKTQRGGVTGVETDKPAEEAAEGGAYCKGGDDFAALEACSESYGGENKLQYEGVPVGAAVQRVHGQIHTCTVEALVANDEGEKENNDCTDDDPQPGVFDGAVSKMLGFVKGSVRTVG